MATIEARGYVNKLELKESARGAYAKFDLAVQQKRKEKDKTEVKETLYYRCVDFNPKELPFKEGDYLGVKGYVTLTKWDGGKTGKGGVNVDVTVQSYEKLEQKGGADRKPAAARAEPAAPPSDPFKLSPEKP